MIGYRFFVRRAALRGDSQHLGATADRIPEVRALPTSPYPMKESRPNGLPSIHRACPIVRTVGRACIGGRGTTSWPKCRGRTGLCRATGTQH
jgi:hypothetical protein